ncbi:MAG: sel1 repeat family protein [Opitutae bacterium]|nr:sel1 repeat family protein [Opitutae bacterium]
MKSSLLFALALIVSPAAVANEDSDALHALLLKIDSAAERNFAAEEISRLAQRSIPVAEGIDGVLRLSSNPEEAGKMLRAAASSNITFAQVLLGSALIRGDILPQDQVEGERLLAAAAKTGDPLAAVLLADYLDAIRLSPLLANKSSALKQAAAAAQRRHEEEAAIKVSEEVFHASQRSTERWMQERDALQRALLEAQRGSEGDAEASARIKKLLAENPAQFFEEITKARAGRSNALGSYVVEVPNVGPTTIIPGAQGGYGSRNVAIALIKRRIEISTAELASAEQHLAVASRDIELLRSAQTKSHPLLAADIEMEEFKERDRAIAQVQAEVLRLRTLAGRQVRVFSEGFSPIFMRLTERGEILFYGENSERQGRITTRRSFLETTLLRYYLRAVSRSACMMGQVALDEHRYADAFRWFDIAASEGNTDAQLALANMYYRGVGTLKDEEAALRWASISLALGNASAAIVVDALRRDGVTTFNRKAAQEMIDEISRLYPSGIPSLPGLPAL